MSKAHRTMMLAPRERGRFEAERSLGARLRRWILQRRSDDVPEIRPASHELLAGIRLSSPGEDPKALAEKVASLQVSVDTLGDRISAEVVEREAKLVEEIRRDMRGLEIELSERFVAATLETKRLVRRGAALVVTVVALLAGLVVAVLSLR